MKESIKDLSKLMNDGSPPSGWDLRAVIQDENLSYLAWNKDTCEALIIDPVLSDFNRWTELLKSLPPLRLLAVIDTHTHADHISGASALAQHFDIPLIMHRLSPSSRIHLRVSGDFKLQTLAGPIRFLETPGHTQDGITVLWGPYLFTGDTILYGDTGRDDLPGGDPLAHYFSLKKISTVVTPSTLVLPGHDCKGGRVTSWKDQLAVNPSLTQDQDLFVREAGSFRGAAPALLKESLFENFK